MSANEIAKMPATTSVEVEIRFTEERIGLYFVDAQMAQWEEDLGTRAEYPTRAALVDEIRSAIEDVADELAETLVADMERRESEATDRGNGGAE
ncbi:hypothetical protein [Microbacterium sp. UBA837]|uniref:hypothetical protein n=1 Tax=Microbacterium sp. UBA837 TaxID=1946956 RepID=UPI0025E20BC8|nr:hypothetical protein [Microbacterium sp. UBA837]|tara:strand:- start:277 stop:558 length:282 start_codon:yes stop_codon:yes gene_type:complete